MLDTIVSFLTNLWNIIAGSLNNFALVVDKICDSLLDTNFLVFSDILPGFLITSVSTLTAMCVLKLIVSLGSYHE